MRVTGYGQQNKSAGAPAKGRRRSALAPAALVAERAVTRLTAEELQLSGDAIETFVDQVGGRAKLVAALAVADGEHQTDKVITTLLDPTYATWSLRKICQAAGITVAELFAAYKKALFARAHIEAAHTITRHLPPIVEDVMRRAQPALLPCPRCQGKAGSPDCWACKGAGEVWNEPDLDRQKLALELGRLTAQHKAGVLVQQNQIAAGGTSSTTIAAQATGSLEQLQQAVGDLLFNPGRRRAASPASVVVDAVVDAVVDNPAPPAAEGQEAPGGV